MYLNDVFTVPPVNLAGLAFGIALPTGISDKRACPLGFAKLIFGPPMGRGPIYCPTAYALEAGGRLLLAKPQKWW